MFAFESLCIPATYNERIKWWSLLIIIIIPKKAPKRDKWSSKYRTNGTLQNVEMPQCLKDRFSNNQSKEKRNFCFRCGTRCCLLRLCLFGYTHALTHILNFLVQFGRKKASHVKNTEDERERYWGKESVNIEHLIKYRRKGMATH